MSKNEVDRYLALLEEPKRSTLDALRRTILDIVPEASQCISYGVPAFRLQGKVIAGISPPLRTTLVTCPIVVPCFLSLRTQSRTTRLRQERSNSLSIGRYRRHS